MLEVLLKTNTEPSPPEPVGPLYEWSGPGNKHLIAGNLELGYFGIVDEEELYSAAELKEELNLIPGVASSTGMRGWLKFVKRGKIIFIRGSPAVGGLSWLELYENGLIFGTSGTPASYAYGPVYDQIRDLEFTDADGTWNLRVRSLDFAVGDPDNDWEGLLAYVCRAYDGGNEQFDTLNFYATMRVETGQGGMGECGQQPYYEDQWGGPMMRGKLWLDSAPQQVNIIDNRFIQWRPVLELLSTPIVPEE